MNKLKQLSVGKQVLFTFGTLCVILLIIGGLFFFSLRSIERSNQLQQSRALNKLALIDDTAQDIGQMQAEVLRQVLASDLGEIKRLDQTIRDIEKTNARELTDYQKLADTEKEKQLYDRVMQARKAYWERTQPVLVFSIANQDAEATQFINSKQGPSYDEFQKAINELADHVETEAREAAGATARFISEIRIIGDVIIGVTIFIVIGTGSAVAGVARRLKEDNRLLQIEVNERKRAEETLRESEERFAGAFEYAPIGVALASPDGHWLKVNRVLCDLVGYTEAELLTRTFQDITHPEDLESSLENVRRMLAGEINFYQMEKHYVHKRGHLVTASLSISLVRDGQGQPLYFIAQIQDITERKRLEAHLFQSQKMETVGKLAGGIAHEFNSILTAIIGQSELLLGDLPAGSPLTKNAEEISKAAGRAATLTRQLLAYGRKQILQPEILDLNAILAGMENTLRHLMGRDVDVRIIPAAGLKAVKADAGQIEQVIMNMAINARDAMPNGGKLTLETANVTFDEQSVGRYPELKPGDYVMLAITDTGTGMSPEVKARVFEPFFSTKDVGEGTGLGLSTGYGIIRQSGGHIGAYSELARGAAFKIYLPQVEPQTEVPTRRLEAPDLPHGTETILLVEDDPALREMAATLLRRLGYTVLAAADGIEALRLKQQRRVGHVDLLFTDVVMPHMNGKELAERVQAIYPHTRILFTSAFTENAIVHQGVLDKGVALLQKPFTPSALAHKLREVLDRVDAPNPDAGQKTFGFEEVVDGVNTP